jgi:hypothetical protein
MGVFHFLHALLCNLKIKTQNSAIATVCYNVIGVEITNVLHR